MATLKEMIDIAGSIEKAEDIARTLTNKKDHLLDLILLLAAQGKPEEAEKYCKLMLAKDPGNIRALYNLGWYYLLRGDMSTGFYYMNEGRRLNCFGNTALDSKMPVWTGQSLEGKMLLFNCEAGYGDVIIFVRFIEIFRSMGAKVTVMCPPEMLSIIARVSGVSAVVDKDTPAMSVYHDYWIPSMYAPVSLKIENKDLSGKPYITPHEVYVQKFKHIMRSDKTKIGVRWLGREGEDYIPRVFPEELLFDAVKDSNTEIYSLQKDIQDKSNYPEWLIDMDDHMTTWEDTLGIMANLDIIVTSCTGVAHLAAAIGKPTMVIVPVMTYFTWVYPTNNRSLWYDSVRLFRQKKWGEWDIPFNELKQVLNNYYKQTRRELCLI